MDDRHRCPRVQAPRVHRYGLATLRAGVLPRWYGLALTVSMPLSLPLAVHGTALFGLILVVLGLTLWLRKGDTAGQRPRVI